MKKIGVFTSGGDAPGMNACIRAVVRSALKAGVEIYGIRRGYAGMIEGDIISMNRQSVSNILQLGGTILRSARSEEFRTEKGRAQARATLAKYGISHLVAIGGDGTFTGARIFLREYPELAIVGVPGTIDNDLYGTDYTIGYDTAINTAMRAIDNIKDTANSHDRVFFIEVMGRDAGFIALRTAIATGAEAVLLPEAPSSIEQLVQMLKWNYENKKTSSIVIVAEGDDAGGAFDIARQVKERMPQCKYRVTILGHIQRGGSPTCQERVLASQLGMEAVQALLEGSSGIMVGQVCQKITYTPLEKAVKHHNEIDKTLLNMVSLLA